ncbi:MAG TPA: LuxR C-terminal-related transcriptional regulator [Marmoricola sp.]|nr:LuxR C-terminal-related transcriptional regulator [Marmoricola sp.]
MSPRIRAAEEVDARTEAAGLLARQEFAAARAAYERLLARHESAEALEGLAAACRPLDDISGTVAVLERAYRLRVDAGEAAEAAHDACLLADVELTELGNSAVASGWLSRARHHFRAVPADPGQVVLEALSAYRAIAYEKDPDAARSFATRALAFAERLGDGADEVMGKAFLGFVDVMLGDLEPGFGLLDEATAAALAGELPPLADLDVYCLLVSACERVRDFDRADQWAQRVLALATGAGSDGFATFARTQYASLLIWRGRWPEAEATLERVLADAGGRPMTAAMAMVLRASLRRRQGRLDDALLELARAEREPYRRAVRHAVLSARARIELDRGEAQAAADLADRYLHAVSPSDLIERVDALETLVRARVVLGELDVADAAATDLDSAAATIGLDAVRAAALATRAEVSRARGTLGDARRQLEDAITLLDSVGLAPDATTARIALAEVLLDLGRPESARAAADAAHAGAAQLGARRDLDAATRVLARIRGDGAGDAAGMTPREVEIVRLIADGLTNAEIAVRLVLSPRTVERHVSNIYLKVGATGPAARTVAVAHARRVGLL